MITVSKYLTAFLWLQCWSPSSHPTRPAAVNHTVFETWRKPELSLLRRFLLLSTRRPGGHHDSLLSVILQYSHFVNIIHLFSTRCHRTLFPEHWTTFLVASRGNLIYFLFLLLFLSVSLPINCYRRLSLGRHIDRTLGRHVQHFDQLYSLLSDLKGSGVITPFSKKKKKVLQGNYHDQFTSTETGLTLHRPSMTFLFISFDFEARLCTYV